MLTISVFSLLTILSASALTESPVIGILSQEQFTADPKYLSYIAASYVKFIESSGAQVIPIWIGQNRSYYERVVNYTNGVLYPGGGVYFTEPNGYGEAAKIIYDLAVQLNKNGDFFPIFGICLGHQVLAYAATGGVDIRQNCSCYDVALPLDLKWDFRFSHLYGLAPPTLIKDISTKSITYNYHRYCLNEDIFDEYKLLETWKILSTNNDLKGQNFISSMEHKFYPFYGIQFHPEKNLFEFPRNKHIPHSRSAIYMSQYFTNFFVDKALKNNHQFPNDEIKENALIYQFTPEYTGNKSSFEQKYYFTEEDFERVQLL